MGKLTLVGMLAQHVPVFDFKDSADAIGHDSGGEESFRTDEGKRKRGTDPRQSRLLKEGSQGCLKFLFGKRGDTSIGISDGAFSENG